MLKRHTLLFLGQAELEFAWEHRESVFPSKMLLETMKREFSHVPAIVRRERETDGWIPIGMALPVRLDGVRVRMSSILPAGTSFVRVVTPEQAAEQSVMLKAPYGRFMQEALRAAHCRNIALGLFGSTALEAITGRPYIHPGSDLDIAAVAKPGAELKKFKTDMEILQVQYGLRADMELALGGGYYGKLAELYSGQTTILAKGGLQPQLLSCQAVREGLHVDG